MPCSMNSSGQPMRTTGVSKLVMVQGLEHRRAEAAGEHMVFHGHDQATTAGVARNALCVHGLGEASVDDGRAAAFAREHGGQALGFGQHAAKREDRHIASRREELQRCRSQAQLAAL